MKLTAAQLRSIISEEVKSLSEVIQDKYGVKVDETPLLSLFGVSSVDEISDEDLALVSAAARAADILTKNRRSEYVATTPLGQRLKPVAADVVLRATRTTPAEAKKNGLVKFFTDGNLYYAETVSGMLWKAGAYEKLKPTGKATADFKAAKKR